MVRVWRKPNTEQGSTDIWYLQHGCLILFMASTDFFFNILISLWFQSLSLNNVSSYFWNAMAESAAAELCLAARGCPPPGLGSSLGRRRLWIKGGFWVERGRVGGCVLCHQTSGLASAGALEGFPGELRVIQIVDAILPCTGKYISPDFPSPVNNTPASVA